MEKKTNICLVCGKEKFVNTATFKSDCVCTNPKGYEMMRFLADKGNEDKEQK